MPPTRAQDVDEGPDLRAHERDERGRRLSDAAAFRIRQVAEARMSGATKEQALEQAGYSRSNTGIFRTVAYKRTEEIVRAGWESELHTHRHEIVGITLGIARDTGQHARDRLRACALLGAWAGLGAKQRAHGDDNGDRYAHVDDLETLFGLVQRDAGVVDV